MKVKELLEGFENKTITKAKLTEMYGIHNKGIQIKLKNAGFEWDRKTANYKYIGDDENIMEVDVLSILKANTNKKDSNNTSKKDSNSTSKKASNNTIKSASNSNSKVNRNLDAIDVLLQGKENNSTRTYRGFYFDNDVLEVIDNASSGKKSELVNLALRKVFSEKGLL